MTELQRQSRAKISGRLLTRPQTARYGDRPPVEDMQTREAVCIEHGVQTAVYLPSAERWGLVCCGREVRDD